MTATRRRRRRAALLVRRAGAWFAGRGIGRTDPDPLRAFDGLNDHYLRDVGLWRERSAGPRRFDPWM